MSPSRIFFWVLASFILGIALDAFLHVGDPTAFLLWAGGAVLFVLGARSKKFFFASALFAAAGLGIFRHAAVPINPPSHTVTAVEAAGETVFVGRIVGYPDTRQNRMDVIVETDILPGRVLLALPRESEYRYGDVLRVRTKLDRPEAFDGFDYPGYLAKEGIFWVAFRPSAELLGRGEGNRVAASLFAVRSWWEAKISEVFPEPQGGFLSGLLLGTKHQLSPNVLDDMQRTGTTHIVALSGFNVTVIIVALFALLRYVTLRQTASFAIAVLFIVGFAVLTGGSPSVVRASVMGVIGLLAWKSGRIYWPRNALALAAAVMLMANPLILRFDVGFALSFLATMGLMYVSPLLNERYLSKLPGALGIRETVSATLGAQAFVLPLLITQFGVLSLVAPLANVLILPAVPLAMLAGFVAVLVSAVLAPLGMFVGFFAHILLSYVLFVAHALAAVPFAAVRITHGALVLSACYTAVFAWWLFRMRGSRFAR